MGLRQNIRGAFPRGNRQFQPIFGGHQRAAKPIRESTIGIIGKVEVDHEARCLVRFLDRFWLQIAPVAINIRAGLDKRQEVAMRRRNWYADVILHARSKNVENPPRKRANVGTRNGILLKNTGNHIGLPADSNPFSTDSNGASLTIGKRVDRASPACPADINPTPVSLPPSPTMPDAVCRTVPAPVVPRAH